MEQKEEGLPDDKDERIVLLMKKDSNIKVNEIRREAGLGMTTITKRIRRLKEEGIIDRRGSKKKGIG